MFPVLLASLIILAFVVRILELSDAYVIVILLDICLTILNGELHR